jgi:epoxyqueuosine reductase
MEISAFTTVIKQAAVDVGFDVVGVAGAGDVPELEYFPDWIASGYAGEMKYLEKCNEAGELKRASLSRVAPWARSVVVCAINYNTDQPYSTEPADPKCGWISRYAWTREDYHDSVMRRLRALETRLRDLVACNSPQHSSDPPRCVAEKSQQVMREQTRESAAGLEIASAADLQTRCYVDTGPIVERVYAKYAGVGWIGKNTCVINQRIGSWLFLGVILTSIELTPDFPAPDRCGTCTRCIEACPTDALVGPYQLDSNKCISYLTIEKRGAIPEELRQPMGRQVYGCDICQDVCPWNRKAAPTTANEFQPRANLVNPALDWLAEMDVEAFRETFRGSPVKRTKLSGLRRNAVIAMANSKDESFVPVLEKLAHDGDRIVSEAASWGLKKLGVPTS